jgi:hypothetical protein
VKLQNAEARLELDLYFRVSTSESGFLVICGTSQSGAGYPTGIRQNARSFDGRPKRPRRNSIGAGVCVRAAKPALCSATSRKPTAIPTDSVT